MDSKELELYQEEQRLELKALNRGISDVKDLLKKQIEEYKPTTEVTVNTEKAVEITNLEELAQSFESLEAKITKAIADNSYKPVSEVTVKNLKDIRQPDKLEVTNLDSLKSYFDSLAEKIENNQPIVNVAKQDIVFPTSADNPIPVRLSDGKSFYKAMFSAVSGSLPFKTSAGVGTQVQLTADGKVPVEASVNLDGATITVGTRDVFNSFDENATVAASSETTITSYTVPAGKTAYVSGFVATCIEAARWYLKIDAVKEAAAKSSASNPTIPVTFNDGMITATAGTVITITGYHEGSSTAEMQANIYGYLL